MNFVSFFLTLALSAPAVFASTVDLSGYGDPCTSETARMQIIEKLLVADRESKPVVFDIGSKRKIMASLDDVIKGKKAGVHPSMAEAFKRQAIAGQCKAEIESKLGSESHPQFGKLYQDLVIKAQQGRISKKLKTAIDADYKTWLEDEQHRMDALNEADQAPEVQEAARTLRAKLLKTNTLKANEVEELTTFLTRHSGVIYEQYVMGWEYTTENDKFTGKEHVVAYRTLYAGNGCIGYRKLERVTEMPAFKLPMKYFDAEKMKKWAKDSYLDGMNSHDFASVPLNFAEFQNSCPTRAPAAKPEGGSPLKKVR